MKQATLGPILWSNEEGTQSKLVCEDFSCLIQELPDRGNVPDKSRINPGDYVCAIIDSPSHGRVYHLREMVNGVEEAEIDGHTHVLIHIGNLAGDVGLGYASDSEACLLPGEQNALFRAQEQVGKHVLTKDQHGVASSGVAYKRLMDFFGGQPFALKIIR